MPTPEEIRKNDLERDRLLQVNLRVPGGRPTVAVTACELPAYQKGMLKGIADRGHREYQCAMPDWCPFCELLKIVG